MKLGVCLLPLIFSCAINNNKNNNVQNDKQRDPVLNSAVHLSDTKIIGDDIQVNIATGVVIKADNEYNYILTVAHFCKDVSSKLAVKSTKQKNNKYTGKVL